jgi:putative endonuclease
LSLGSRRAAESRGRLAESRCALRLRLKGYRILARRFQTRVGEVDIIARRGRIVAFIEVKARDSEPAAAESITSRQRRRILAAAKTYIARNPHLADHEFRFDVMLVAGWGPPHHILDAWRE